MAFPTPDEIRKSAIPPSDYLDRRIKEIGEALVAEYQLQGARGGFESMGPIRIDIKLTAEDSLAWVQFLIRQIGIERSGWTIEHLTSSIADNPGTLLFTAPASKL